MNSENEQIARREPFKRAFKWSSILHGFVIGALLIWPLLHGLFTKRESGGGGPIMLIPVNPASPGPAPAPTPPKPEPEPEPEPQPPPTPKPEPPPVPPKPDPDALKVKEEKKPEPPKTNVVVKSNAIVVSTNRVNRPKTAVVVEKHLPTPTVAEIERALNGGGSSFPGTGGGRMGGPGGGGGPGAYSVKDAFERNLGDRVKRQWELPGRLPLNLRTRVTFHVLRDGTITQCTLRQSSGNQVMDDSVMAAARSVTKVEPLPDAYWGTYADITIGFEPED